MDCDFLVIGAGIAGASAAYELAAKGRVVLVEREDRPGYHTTGRSAALFTETYGIKPVRVLTSASRGFHEKPPAGFADHPILTPRGCLTVADAAHAGALAREVETARATCPSARAVDTAEALRICPALKPESAALGLLEPGARDIDVAALHQGFLKGLKARGGTLAVDAEVTALERKGSAWHARTKAGAFAAAVVVNAAGAWVDRVASLAGVAQVGLVPKRRTAITFDPPASFDARAWPMVADAGETWYFKPDAGRLMASPADETPSQPCDAQPEDLDVAVLIDRLQTATALRIARPAHKWAGLRSFVKDKMLVAGFAPEAEGFFFLAGQGGYGIQTSPAMARVAAALASGAALPADIRAAGLAERDFSPARLI